MATNEQLNNEVQDINVKLGVHEQRLTSAEQAIERLSNENHAIYELNTNVRLLAENMTSVKSDVEEVKADVKSVKTDYTTLGDKVDNEISKVRDDVQEVKNQPNKAKAEWYDKIVWLIVGGAATYIVNQIITQVASK